MRFVSSGLAIPPAAAIVLFAIGERPPFEPRLNVAVLAPRAIDIRIVMRSAISRKAVALAVIYVRPIIVTVVSRSIFGSSPFLIAFAPAVVFVGVAVLEILRRMMLCACAAAAFVTLVPIPLLTHAVIAPIAINGALAVIRAI